MDFDFPKRFTEGLRKVGDIPIHSMHVARHPIQKTFDRILNVISFGEWDKAKGELGHDDMYHLYLVLEYKNGVVWILEKNERLNLYNTNLEELEKIPNITSMPIRDYNDNERILNLSQLLDTAFNDLVDLLGKPAAVERFFQYDPQFANCQRFITDILMANDLLNVDENAERGYSGVVGVAYEKNPLYNFINQDAEKLINRMPEYIQIIMRGAPMAAATIDKLRHGGKDEEKRESRIQAVLFAKDKWTAAQARAWLKKHDLKPIKTVHKTKNFLRYRIIDPTEFEKYYTEKMDDDIQLVMGVSES